MLFLWQVIVAAIVLTATSDVEGSTCDPTNVRCYPTNLKSLLTTAGDLISEAQKCSPSCDTCTKFPMDCAELRLSGQNKGGVYKVWPISRALPEGGAVSVYCDMTADGGGWTVIQRRGEYGRPKDYFFQDWKHYKEGFGNVLKDFWLGNDYIYALTNQRKTSIRFDLLDGEGEHRYAVYDHFWIDNEAYNYTLHVEGYSGTAGESFSGSHNGMQFSTKDRDNDLSSDDCSGLYKGGWWYGACHASNLNGLYLNGKHESYADGIEWSSWKELNYSLSQKEMKIRPVNFYLRKP